MDRVTEPTPKGRPGGRTARTTQAVIDATTALLSEVAPADLTVGQIAAHAGVNAATVYRKWGTKEALLREVLLTLSAERLTTPDTGSLRGDLVATVAAVADFLRTPAGYALAALAATAEDDTSQELRDAFWGDRFERAERIFTRAVERGELLDADDALLAYEAMIATLHFRILARRRALDADIAVQLVDLMLGGVNGQN